MFGFAASQQYWDWLYAQPIIRVGYTKVNLYELTGRLPFFVYVAIIGKNGKEEKITTNIILGDALKEVPNIKPYKRFVGMTVGQMHNALKGAQG